MIGGEEAGEVERLEKMVRVLIHAGVLEEKNGKFMLTPEFADIVKTYTKMLRLRDAVRKALTDYLGEVPTQFLRDAYILVSSMIVLKVRDSKGMLPAKIVEEELMSAPFLAEE
ncbi:MAG: hypothetical protein QXT92_00115 [Nitrososphaerota archaeon]